MEQVPNKSAFASGSKSSDILDTKNELEMKKKTYNSINVTKLPDKGARLKNQIDELENILKSLSLEADATSNVKGKIKSSSQSLLKSDGDASEVENISDNKSKAVIPGGCNYKGNSKSVLPKGNTPFCEISSTGKMLSFSDLTPKQTTKNVVNENVMSSPSFQNWRDKGKVHKTLLTEPKPFIENSVLKTSLQYQFCSNPILQTNEECVKKIHNSLVTYPDDTEEESEPEDLKSSLMIHQKKGLAWLIWREQQDPSGGILADDMGLGKTLTMISLILMQKEKHNYISFKEEKNQCRGTLIICLASIIHQWNDEITKHCENNALKVLIYHGPKREKKVKQMMTYDVVLTTYNIILSEKKAMDNKVESPLFKLKWERIVLDEAHTIKNHSSQTAQAIFSLRAFRRWAITGTPIHNVFKDIYSLVKFLQFSPFDDYKKFKGLTDECSDSGEQRRNLLIKSIVLRRTKEQVDELGKPLIEMSNKSMCIRYIELSAEERKIYDKLNEKITKKFYKYFEKPSKLRSNTSLLVLLLRLQQCCNHLSLLVNEAEEDDISTDITNCLSSLTIDETVSDSNSSESNLDLTFNELETDKLSDKASKSSKIKELFEELHKISENSRNKDKSVIVSQWVSMLDIIAYHLKEENIAYHLIAGNTKVEDRQKFAVDFNYNDNGSRIMLLSLKAGGVGLNLIGANHLFLLDLHWNPALEMQACDRIHRVGQKKDVVIHKFICKNTIEEKIKSLQDEKRRIASSALHGIKQNTKGLSIEDFKILFSVRKN